MSGISRERSCLRQMQRKVVEMEDLLLYVVCTPQVHKSAALYESAIVDSTMVTRSVWSGKTPSVLEMKKYRQQKEASRHGWYLRIEAYKELSKLFLRSEES